MAVTTTLATFERYAQAAGAHVTRADSEEAAAAAILAGSTGPVRCTPEVRARYAVVCRALGEAGVRVEVAGEDGGDEADRSSLAAALAGGIGIVAAHAGVSETGSVLLADDALAARLLGMLADVCVVLLPASAVVASLDDAGSILAELDRNGHRYLSLVTGPSRTADIERVLTIGVQGPRALHIIVIEETGSPT